MAKIIHLLGLEHRIGDGIRQKGPDTPGMHTQRSTHGHMTLRPWRGSGQRALRRRALIVAPRCSQVALALRQPLEAARAGCSTACSCATVAAAARVASMAVAHGSRCDSAARWRAARISTASRAADRVRARCSLWSACAARSARGGLARRSLLASAIAACTRTVVRRPPTSTTSGCSCGRARISTNFGLSAGCSSRGEDRGERDRRPDAASSARVDARPCVRVTWRQGGEGAVRRPRAVRVRHNSCKVGWASRTGVVRIAPRSSLFALRLSRKARIHEPAAWVWRLERSPRGTADSASAWLEWGRGSVRDMTCCVAQPGQRGNAVAKHERVPNAAL